MGKRDNAQDRRTRRRDKAVKKKRAEEKSKAKESARAAAAAEQEEDIEKILREVEAQLCKQVGFSEEQGVPSPRVHASFLPHPERDELVLFGGEFSVGAKTTMYNNLCFYNIKKREWKSTTVPGSPPPRSAHQAAMIPRGGGELWIFGGEFISPSGAQFRHYNDLWRYQFAEKAWDQITAKGGPSPRSGHRMVAFKKRLVVFGGFHDDDRRAARYFDDLHVFNIETAQWSKLSFPPVIPSPEARSAFHFVPTADGILMFGGFSKERVKGENFKSRRHNDVWLLTARELLDEERDTAAARKDCDGELVWKWNRSKFAGEAPAERSSAGSCVRDVSKSCYFFGGVHDEETEDALLGTFLQDFHTLDLASLRWHEVSLKESAQGPSEFDRLTEMQLVKKEQAKKKKQRRRRRAKDKKKGEAAAAAAAAALSSDDSDGEEDDGQADAAPAAAPAAAGAAATGPAAVWPSRRMNAMMAVKGSTLFLYGGLVEVGDRQLCLSDMFSLDLGKLDRWIELFPNDPRTRQWLEDHHSESSSSSDDEEEEDDE
eukprot:m.125330 g.125330  ORF g.125330 m.125330 type:complete len:543 (-) comp9688_c0_seq13:120-1748(-)